MSAMGPLLTPAGRGGRRHLPDLGAGCEIPSLADRIDPRRLRGLNAPPESSVGRFYGAIWGDISTGSMIFNGDPLAVKLVRGGQR